MAIQQNPLARNPWRARWVSPTHDVDDIRHILDPKSTVTLCGLQVTEEWWQARPYALRCENCVEREEQL